MHTDIVSRNWIDKFLPESSRPYARLARLDRPVGTWLLLLPCWWALVMGGESLPLGKLAYYALLFGIGAVVMRSAGCVVNDMWDRDIDRQVERTQMRPLASGAVSMRQASVLLSFLLLIGLGIAVQFPAPVIGYGLPVCVLVAIYPLMKRVTWWPQAVLGVTLNWGVIVGAIAGMEAGAGGETMSWILPAWAWLLYAAGVLWTLGYDTIYAHQDKEDDARVGVKSTARRLGAASRIWVSGFYSGVIALLVLAGLVANMGWTFYPVVILLAGGHLAWQVRTWEMDNPANCLHRFKSNRDFGLFVLLAVVCGTFIG